ncbi:MAG: hypothetical protein ACYST5_21450 [Planctomycetota bacterium]
MLVRPAGIGAVVDLDVLVPVQVVEVHFCCRCRSELLLIGGVVCKAQVTPIGAPALCVMVVSVVPDGRIIRNPPHLDRICLTRLEALDLGESWIQAR